MSDAAATPSPSAAAPAGPVPPRDVAGTLLRAAAAGILGVEPDGTIGFANPEAARILGFGPDDAAGRSLHGLLGFPTRGGAGSDGASPIREALRDGTPRRGDAVVVREDGGAPIPIEYSAAPIVEEGRITGAAVTLRESAGRPEDAAAERERQLAEALNERTRRILESITDAFFALDHGWRFTWLNDEAEHLLQRTREALMGRGIWDEFPAAVGTLFQQEYERAVREQRPVGFEAYYPPPLDAWYEVRAYPSDDGLSVFFRNVNERVTVQRALRESEERYRSLIEATSAIVWSTAASGEFGGEQPGWSAFTGQAPEAFAGMGWMECVHPDDRARTAADWTTALEARRPYETEHRLRRADGEYRHMWVRAVPVLHADGSIREWVGVHTDITEERNVEAALRRSEESYRFLADTIPQLVWTTLPDGYHEYYNRRWYEYTGMSYDQARGTGWNDVLHPGDQERARDRWRHSLETGEPYSIEYRFKRHDGVYRWFLGQALPFRDDEGRILRWFGTCTDIHDQKEAQQERDRLIAALDVERARLNEVFREAPALILVTRGPEHRIEMANPPYRRLVGGREIEGLPVRQALPEVAGQGLFELLDTVYRTGEPVSGSEMPVALDRGGGGALEEGWFNFVYQPLRNPLGSVEGILVHAVEVTDQVRARRLVERLEERLRLALESADIGTWDFHPRTGLLSWDARCKQVFGLEAGDTVDYGVFLSRLHPADRARTDGLVQDALDPAGPGGYDTEYRVLWPDGTTRWIRAAGRAFFDGAGAERQAVRFTGTVLDVTERRRAEDERERLIRDLEASNRELDQFAYVASHDLKAPLRGIANLSEWLEEDLGGRLEGDSRQHMDLLRGRVHRMEGLIDGILQYSRAGRVREAAEAVDTDALVAEVVDLLAPPPEVEVRVMEGMPTVTAERLPLQQVFMNLIGNAVKYGAPEGGRITVSAAGDEGGGWVFSVADDGPGIAPAYHDRIFGIFQTLQPRDRVEGTGIGLSLVKKIVESRGGRVWVQSAEGAGATFQFHWPGAQSANGAA